MAQKFYADPNSHIMLICLSSFRNNKTKRLNNYHPF